MTSGDDSKRSAGSARPSRGTLVQTRAPRVSSESRQEELAARKRVAALVSGGLHFHVKRQGDRIQAARGTAAAKSFARLSNKTFAPEHKIDLEGRSVAEMDGVIAGFLRVVHRRGVKHVLISFGAHGDDCRELREEGVIAALTRGSAAALVRAFVSPHDIHGGTNALALLLV